MKIAECRFCRSLSPSVVDDLTNFGKRRKYFVECSCCSARGPWSEWKRRAAIYWNEQKASPALLTLYRPVAETLEDSMREELALRDFDDLVACAYSENHEKIMTDLGSEPFSTRLITVHSYGGRDDRIAWPSTYLVKLRSLPWGYVSAIPKDTPRSSLPS